MRRFGEQELEALHVIECLKASGLEIRDIRQFMQWCTEGASSYPKRRQLLERQKETLESQMDDLRRSLAMLQFKCWYCEQAMRDGGEEHIHAMLPDKLPPEVQVLYDLAHGRTPGKTELNVSTG